MTEEALEDKVWATGSPELKAMAELP